MNAPILPTIVVRFSCHKCGIRNQEVVVLARQPGEDIAHFLEQAITPALGASHHQLSPHCQTNRLSDVQIPADSTIGVGAPTVH